MSANQVDDRVMKLEFDNKSFENNVAHTLSSLSRLKDSLLFKNGTSGLDKIEAAANHFSLKNLENNVSSINQKFSGMGVAFGTVISRLTSGAIGAGLKMGHALLDPIIQGGTQRAEAIQQAQFQFKGLGINVQAAMASALAAVKGTAYGLDAAASAAAQFGASGVKAGAQMTKDLTAISGVAAMTGSSYQDIASIFTTIAGNGRVMSVQLEQFSSRGLNAAAALAKQMGVSEAQVRKMVTQGKISFQEFATAMDNAFGKHAKDANQTFKGSLDNLHAALARLGAEAIAPELLNLRDIFNALGPAVDSFHKALIPAIGEFTKFATEVSGKVVKVIDGLDFSKLTGVFTNLFQTFLYLKTDIGAILSPIRQAFRDIFGGPSVAGLLKFTEGLKNLAEGMKIGDKTAYDIWRTFQGLFALLHIGWEIIKGVGEGLKAMFSDLSGTGSGILTLTGNLGDYLVSLDDAIRKGNVFGNFFQALGHILSVPIILIGALAKGIGNLFGGFHKKDADNATNGVKTFGNGLQRIKDLGDSVDRMMQRIGNFFAGVAHALAPFGNAIKNSIDAVWHAITDAFSTGHYHEVLDVFNTTFLGAIVFSLKKFFEGGLKINFNSGIIGSLHKTVQNLNIDMKAMQQTLKAKTLVEIATALALLAASAVLLAGVDSAKLTKAMAALAVGFGELLASMAILDKITKTSGFIKMPLMAASMILLAGAMIEMALAVRILAGMSWAQMARGLTAFAVTLGVIALAMKPLSAGGGINLLLTSAGLTALGIALEFIAAAIKVFGTFDWLTFGVGLTNIAITLGILGLAIRAIPKGILLQAVALNLIALALQGLYLAVSEFGKLKWDTLVRGLAGVAGALVAIAAGMRIMPKNMLTQSVALIAVGTALNIIAKAINSLGHDSWTTIGKGLITIGGALGILAVGLRFMNGTIPGSLAIIPAAFGLKILAGVIKGMGAMSWGDIAKGLIGLAAGLAVLGVASAALSGVAPEMLLAGAALIVFGGGLIVAGEGLKVFSAGLQAFIDLLVAIPTDIAKFVTNIINGVHSILGAFGSLVAGIAGAVGKVLGFFGKMVGGLLLAAASFVGPFVGHAVKAVGGFIGAIINNTGKAISAVGNFIGGVLSRFTSTAGKLVSGAFTAMSNFVKNIGRGIATGATAAYNGAVGIAKNIAGGIVDGLAKYIPGPVKSVLKIAGGLLGSFASALGINSPSKEFAKRAAFIPIGVSKGIDDNAKTAYASVTKLSSKMLDTMTESIAGISGLDPKLTPTIAPVLDLTGVKRDAAQINGLITPTPISPKVSTKSATSISANEGKIAAAAAIKSQVTTESQSGVVINFEQNNNSPKALSAVDIYRQTKNQLSQAKEALSA